MLVKMNVTNRNESFTVDTITGTVTGRTYPAKEFLKDNFNAKWNPEAKQWTVDVDKFNTELSQYADYYKNYIVEIIEMPDDKKENIEEKETSSDTAVNFNFSEIHPAKTIVSKELVNKDDGFYNKVTYSDGTTNFFFVG